MAGKKTQAQLTPEEKLQQALVPIAEQPYKIPANWCWTKLMFIAKGFQYGYTEKATLEKIGPKYIRISDINNGNIDLSDAPYCKITDEYFLNYELKKGDILIARMGSVGVNAMFSDNERAVFASYLIRIIPIINNKFLSNFFKTDFYWHQIGDSAKGTTRLNVNANILKKMFVPLPPLAEQQRIVERIESLFAKLDEAKENMQNVLEGFETRKAAILHKAFTGELTAKWRKQHGVSMDTWEEKKLGDVTDILSSKRIYKNEYVNEGIPFFRSSEIVDLYEYGYTEPKFFISKDRYDEINKKYGVPEVGDLLVTSVGTIGKTWIVDERKFYYKDGNITQVKKNSSINMKYLNYFICSENFKKQVSDTVAGTAYNALTIIKFKNILISIPTLPEQTEIVRIIDGLLAKEQQANELSENALAKIDLIKKAILARAFRGELGTNNPADEPAIELLKRVL